jgi:hypothetical protein
LFVLFFFILAVPSSLSLSLLQVRLRFFDALRGVPAAPIDSSQDDALLNTFDWASMSKVSFFF